MNRSRYKLLSGAAFTAHQNAPCGSRDATDARLEFQHRFAIANKLLESGRLIDQPLVVGLERGVGSGPYQRDGKNARQMNCDIKVQVIESLALFVEVNCS